MSKPIAAEGSLVDIRNINTHKVIRLVIDIPAEKAGEIIRMFGWPTQVNPVPVAIAKLDLNRAAAEPDGAMRRAAAGDGRPADPVGVVPATGTNSRKQSWDSMAPAQQCGVLCGDPSFWLFLKQGRGWMEDIRSSDGAAEAVRSILGVNSRRDIKPGSPQYASWNAMASDFRLWTRYPDYVSPPTAPSHARQKERA